MTAKEKANQLVYKFYNLRAHETMEHAEIKAAYAIAKEAAVICVGEIISITGPILQLMESGDSRDANYWEEVKKELSLLKL